MDAVDLEVGAREEQNESPGNWEGEKRNKLVNVGVAEDTDVDDCLLVVLVLGEECLEAVDRRAGGGDDVREDLDVNLFVGGLELH